MAAGRASTSSTTSTVRGERRRPPRPLLCTRSPPSSADGIALLEAIEKVVPGTVDAKKINADRAKLNTF